MPLPAQHAVLAPLRTPWAHLITHARDRGADPALFDIRGEDVSTRTWAEVALRVERGAAALLRAAFRPHQVVIVMLEPSADTVEVEVALRTVGSVPVYVAPDVTPAELARHVHGVDVRLVIADDEDRLTALRDYDSTDVEHLLLGETRNWDRLQEVGAQHLLDNPHCVREAGESPEIANDAPLLIRREDDTVAVRRMPGATPESSAETVLLNGPQWDPRVAAVRATQLANGEPLAWTGDASRLPLMLQVISPTVLATFAASDTAVTSVLHDAVTSGRHWHRSSADPLAAVVAVLSGARVGPGVRRRAQSVSALAPWFGPAMRAVMLDPEREPALHAVTQALSLKVLSSMAVPLEAVALPRAATSRRPSPAKDLPRRNRTRPDQAFEPIPTPPEQRIPPGQVSEHEEQDEDASVSTDLPPLSLFGGESMLDRLLASQTAETP